MENRLLKNTIDDLIEKTESGYFGTKNRVHLLEVLYLIKAILE